MIKKLRFFLLLFFVFLLFPQFVIADDSFQNQFVTIVNPIRISTYSTNPAESLISQYSQVQKRGLPASWLLNYDVISNGGVVKVAQSMNSEQELGLFLEVTPSFAKDANVAYNKTDSWHRASSLFLSGYTQANRRKLIDRIFEKFKDVFGYYPSSVGAWWVDSYSLNYMKEKYNITANLTCADQFATDGYEIWGQYWSTPFYPSKIHAGIPAQTKNSKLDIVTIQWATRDPLNGYGLKQASLFSTQDYFDINYFQKLLNIYAKSHSNKYGHITIGLEGDFPPNTYSGFFASQLEVINKESKEGTIKALNMKDFSDWYRKNFPDLSPAQIIESEDPLGKNIKTIWYQSPNFRINLTYNGDTQVTQVRDFRTYHENFYEPYYISPNRDLNLTINLPSEIDTASDIKENWSLFTDKLNNLDSKNEEISLYYLNHQIKISKDNIKIDGEIENLPNSIINSPLINVKKGTNEINLNPKRDWNFPAEGYLFRSLTQEGTFFLKQKKVILVQILTAIIFSISMYLIMKIKLSNMIKYVIVGVIIFSILGFSYRWYLSSSRLYLVPPAELDALNRLKLMSGKRVVVYDKVCLQCSWHTPNMPAVFANKRDYVKKITGKDILYNSKIFTSKTRPEAKQELDKLKADYIYLVRFEDYAELTPFSPGDLNIEEIYSNANAQIWRVRKN